MAKAGFDLGKFQAALNAHRAAKRLTWKDVAQQSGVSASTLTRMSQGKRPDVDGLALLLAWSGLDALQFVPTANEPEPMANIAANLRANLRADRRISEESAKALEEIFQVAYERFADR